MSKFNGTDFTVTIDGVKIGNNSACSLTIGKKRIGTYTKTTAQSNRWDTSFNGSLSWMVTSTINIDFAASANAKLLMWAEVGDAEVLVRFYNPDFNAYFRGYARVRDSVFTGIIDQVAQYSCSFDGFGSLWFFTPECPPFFSSWLQDPISNGISWSVSTIDAISQGDGSNDSNYLYWGDLSNDAYDYDTRTVTFTYDYEVDAGTIDVNLVYYSGGSWSAAQDTDSNTLSGSGSLAMTLAVGSTVTAVGIQCTSLGSDKITISSPDIVIS